MTLKDYILDKLDQASIFARYLNISESDIKDCVIYKSKIKSPFRDDPDPSLSFKYFKEKLVCRDFGDIYYSGDIFEIVAKLLDKDVRNAEDFIFVCKHIINTDAHGFKAKPKDKTNLIEDPTKITIISRNFNGRDFKFFWKCFIDREIVIKNYIPVKTYSINDISSRYYSSAEDPCYAYVNNPNCYKLYFPFRGKNEKRFISNNKIPIELLNTLRVTNYKILIKANKDKLLMEYVCSLLNITDIQFLAVSSESARLKPDIVALLKKYTRKGIYTMFDLDKCGFESAFLYKHEYGFENIFMGDDSSLKDPTDLVSSIKLEQFLKLFLNIYNTF